MRCVNYLDTSHETLILSASLSCRNFLYAKIKYSLATAILFNCKTYLFIFRPAKNNIFNTHEQLCNGGVRAREEKEMIKPLKIHDRICWVENEKEKRKISPLKWLRISFFFFFCSSIPPTVNLITYASNVFGRALNMFRKSSQRHQKFFLFYFPTFSFQKKKITKVEKENVGGKKFEDGIIWCFFTSFFK